MVQPWNEPERDGHAPFPVSRWQATCLPRITISLPFANSEFTFANNLRLNTRPVGPQRSFGAACTRRVNSHKALILGARSLLLFIGPPVPKVESKLPFDVRILPLPVFSSLTEITFLPQRSRLVPPVITTLPLRCFGLPRPAARTLPSPTRLFALPVTAGRPSKT